MDKRLREHELGFLEIVDRPETAELASYYATKYYQTSRGNYRSSYSDFELNVIREKIRQKVCYARSFMPEKSTGQLLDVGCGEGFAMAAFADVGWGVSGIDYSKQGISSFNPELSDKLEIGDVFSNLSRRITSGETFDIVWLGNVLEHVLDPIELLSAIRQLIAADGLLVLTVPNDGNAYHEMLFNEGLISERFWICPPDHLSYFTTESLRSIALTTHWDCMDIQGDFPIDFFLAHEGSNYVKDKGKGQDAHQARLKLEALIAQAGDVAANKFYSALAGVGLGRNITAYLRPIEYPRPKKRPTPGAGS